ncbi:MAG: class I SAM-dependent methyltransferase [Betaproteobacteria bacterium]|nr:class I SAM-dependent methyltransferase [Betaproteobacteria bacterium]
MFKKIKALRLDVEALFSQVVHGHGYLHYGYWPAGHADEVTLQRLGLAQRAYFDRLCEAIPASTKSILDVGSGTGSNALGLTGKGYSIDCVCPSPKLNAMARQKLPSASRIFESKFEELEISERYDLVLFCESFHYLDARLALRRLARYAKKHVLIFDYFPRKDSQEDKRVSRAQFGALMEQEISKDFAVQWDLDVTQFIAPTFEVLDGIKNDFVQPFCVRLIQELKHEHPVMARMLAFPLRKALAKLQNRSNRHQTFPAQNEYRLLLLARG